jgi:uncharacterized membrane protein YidH (DUF202 family)
MSPSRQIPLPDDGTTQLLRWGSLILLAGIVAIGLLMTVFGGVGVEGARNNLGWLALIIGAMCLPFGLMLTVLGAAKWLRNRSASKKQ